MKVRMKTCLVGGEFVIMPGQIHECDADEAARLIAADLAEPIAKSTGAESRETATITAPETSGKGRKKSA